MLLLSRFLYGPLFYKIPLNILDSKNLNLHSAHNLRYVGTQYLRIYFPSKNLRCAALNFMYVYAGHLYDISIFKLFEFTLV